jgi:hypothetical protein
MTAEIDPGNTNISVFILKFKNTGKTPALNVSEIHHTIEDVNSIPANDLVIPKSSLLLAPDGVFMIHSDSFESRFVAGIKNGTQTPVYMYGQITYDDIFRHHHLMQFCWGFEGGGHNGPASVHNSCDEEQGDENKQTLHN